MSQLVRAKIRALGTYVPPRLLTNSDLEKMVETSNDWIVERVRVFASATSWKKASLPAIWRQPPPNAHWNSVASVPTTSK